MTAAQPIASRWLIPPPNAEAASALARALGIGEPAARVLVHRGCITPDAARQFLRPTLDQMHDPYLLRDMDRAIARLRAAIAAREKILLYGDYDVDGTTSIVILKKTIEVAGGSADYHVPHRLSDGYGMRPEVIDRAAAEGVRLVISVDTGIRARDVVLHARELGIDVIVTDHHLPEEELPPALAVINPNRADCSYPEKNLCGAGVTFKLVQALVGSLNWGDDKVRRYCESLLKMVAIATVADVVPLTGENRVIVKRGLASFGDVRNPGLRELMRVAGLREGDCPTAGQVGFRIAPRMNAAGRMANAADVVELFLTADTQRARELAASLHDLNKERQQTEADIVNAILDECTRVPVGESQAAVIFSAPGWHKGVVGIVAGRLVERFHRPAFVLSEDPETGVAQGSGRSIRAFHLLEAMESMRELFTKFGGHRQAAGVTLPVSAIAEFRRRLNDYALARLSPDDLRPTREFDSELSLAEITDASAADLLALAPFGFGNPCPLFAVLGVEVAGPPQVMNEKHLRLAVKQNGRTIFLKAWGCAERAAEVQPGGRLDLAIAIEEDTFGSQRWCAVLKDFRPAGSGPTSS